MPVSDLLRRLGGAALLTSLATFSNLALAHNPVLWPALAERVLNGSPEALPIGFERLGRDDRPIAGVGAQQAGT